jgi:predicted nucleotidyltransferase
MSKKKPSKNVQILDRVAKGLKGLERKVVFVGGATIGLFITDTAAPATRPTDDVDCVVEVVAQTDYHRLEEELRGLGLTQDMSQGAPIYRWILGGIKVDIMPTQGAILGFDNRWYPDGVAHAQTVELPDGELVAVFSVPYLLASKLEAFYDRGNGDYYASQDLEDIVALIDGCVEIREKIAEAPGDVKKYLANNFTRLLADDGFVRSIEGHLPRTEGAGRVERYLRIMRDISRIT